MLQMLMMTAMHLPNRISSKDIRHEKIKVMESLRPLQKEDVISHVVRGQYSSGEIKGERVVDIKRNQQLTLLQQMIHLLLLVY
jgi:glucose-6-phosphate 1-dehydrogenase